MPEVGHERQNGRGTPRDGDPGHAQAGRGHAADGAHHRGRSPTGFAPRKAATTIYPTGGVATYDAELAQLGPHTTGVGCVYVRDLETVDLGVLERVVAASYARVTAGTFRQRAREGGAEG